MAHSTPSAPGVSTPVDAGVDPEASEIYDAVALLRRDHDIVDLLFDEFDGTDAAQCEPIARRICKMLTVHTQIEEELFYPAVRVALRDNEAVDRAIAEHAQSKQLIRDIEAMAVESVGLRPTMQRL